MAGKAQLTQLALTGEVAVAPSAAVHNYALPADVTHILATPTADVDWTGIAAGFEGQVVILSNEAGSFTITLRQNSGSSSAGNKLFLRGGLDHRLFPGATGAFIYRDSAWKLIASTGDYREGNWTPGIAIGGLTTGITYAVQTGDYTRIGRQYICRGAIQLTSKGSLVGDVTITGLPATTAAAPGAAVAKFGYYEGLTGAGLPLAYSNGAGTSLAMRYATATNAAGMNQSHLTNDALFWFQVEFYV